MTLMRIEVLMCAIRKSGRPYNLWAHFVFAGAAARFLHKPSSKGSMIQETAQVQDRMAITTLIPQDQVARPAFWKAFAGTGPGSVETPGSVEARDQRSVNPFLALVRIQWKLRVQLKHSLNRRCIHS